MSHATDKNDSDLLYGVPAIAAYLNIRPRQAYHLIDKAELPAFKLSGKVCARQRDLAKWLDGKAVAHA
ncbi:helix-turn-helix domain-containing protein [Azospirillum brasilense]|nr:helix-turn-helix domain-containing protein [Azospirillum argentinense]